MLIAHQANVRIIGSVGKRLGIDPDRVMVNIDRVGNTSAASIPIVLDETWRSGRIKPGDLVLHDGLRGRHELGGEPDPVDRRLRRPSEDRVMRRPDGGAGHRGVQGHRPGHCPGARRRRQHRRGRLPLRRSRGRGDGRRRRPPPGTRASAVEIDVADEASVEAAFKLVEQDLGPVGILVNNAGMSRDGLDPQVPDGRVGRHDRHEPARAPSCARAVPRAAWPGRAGAGS